MRKTLPAAVTAAVGLAVMAPLSAAAMDHDDYAELSVLHGVPGLTVDVYVDGELTLDDFEPGELAGPLELPAGDYEVAITAADAEDDSDPVLGPVDLTLEEDGNYTAAAHLDAEGAPTVTAFENDTDELAAGEGRLTVRHIAAAPAVDVWAGDEVVVPGLENPDEASLEIPAGTVPAAISVAGTTEPVLGPADVEVAEGMTTIAYAWGSAEDGTLALATQAVEAEHMAPTAVSADVDVAPAGPSAGLLAAGGAALAALAAGSWTVARRRAAHA
ncbi:DUF4397 domain-containing protein [Micrococcus flavus]|uniref:Uncharacterized protein n=1 Tax=Micrococcus flavus TaxID=384602 RepID=A0A4Y8WWZ2_9MICC|nr:MULTISPECIES: DUF4397 domain-containing protein [Micrococcus]MBB4883583.1 hypothetical protein [Micrococcus flavus]MDO4239742.1 DUF4397 domain-containing protein [Micrococcus sp.]TFH99540.1 DUF4397 domain-containing protein [Micrococcus flavus]GGK54657.1 lipoprotein [Micrococcus flavus]